MVRGHARTVSTLVVAIALVFGAWGGSAFAQTKLGVPSNGYPIKIGKSGSYIVTANLVANAKNVNIINVTVPNVIINLNGFRIGAPGSGTGIGVNASSMANVTVYNGSVSGMGADGILLGDNGVVRDVQVNSNGGNGVNCTGVGCLVVRCTANSNTGHGLNFADTSSGYNEDVMNGNGAPQVSGGTSMGSNVCGGAAC